MSEWYSDELTPEWQCFIRGFLLSRMYPNYAKKFKDNTNF